MNIGEAIKTLRKARGVRQKVLAEAVDVSATHLSLVESGAQKPSVDLLHRIATYFGLPVSTLVYMALDKDTLNNNPQQEYFTAASPIIDKLIAYLLSDSPSSNGKARKVKLSQKARTNKGQ